MAKTEHTTSTKKSQSPVQAPAAVTPDRASVASTADPLAMQAAVGTPGAATPQALLSLQRAYGNRAVGQAIQRASVGARGGDVDAGTQSAIQGARGGGQTLDKGVSAQMGSAFGASFDHVKVHTDTQSDSLNRSMSAKAFTLGSDLFFSRGAYQPNTSSGKQLLAHELTHVVQQGGTKPNKARPEPGRRVQTKLLVGPAGDKYEQEADRVASQVMRSLSAPAARPDEPGRVRRQVAPLRISRLSVQRTGVQRIQRIFSLDPRKWGKTQKQIDDAQQEKEKQKKEKQDDHNARLDDASKWERNLGKYLFNHTKAQGASKTLNDRMVKALIGDVDKDNVDTQKKIAETFGGKTKKYAGTVGTDFADVWAVLNEGNLRERMTAFMNALFGPFKETMLKIMKESAWEDAETRGMDVRKLKIRKRQHGGFFKGGNLGAKKDNWIKDESLKGSKDIFRAPRNPFDRKKLGSNELRLLKGETRSEKPKGEDTITKRNVGELEEGPHKAGLSEREKAFMFGKDKQGDDLSGERLSWEEGGSKWIMKDKSLWVKKWRDELKMPVVAGPSGTALRFYQSWEWLKKPVAGKDLRLALLGWMLVENDHSFHEIMDMGKDYGLPYKPGHEAYHFVDPLTSAELRKNVNLDPAYPGLFPDEVAYHRKLDKGGFKLMKPYKNEMESAQHNQLAQQQFKMGKDTYEKAGLDKLLKNVAAYTSLPYQIQNIVASSSPLVAKARIGYMLKQGRKNTDLLAAMKAVYVEGKDRSTLTKEQLAALEGFKDWNFGMKNIMYVLMHNPDVTAEDLIKESKEHNVQTTRAMALLPTFAGTVYRGESNFGMPYKNGKTITVSKFTSSSRNTNSVTAYAKAKWPMTPVALEIKIKSGRDVNAPTVNEDDAVKQMQAPADLDEVVILPGTKLKVSEPPAVDGRFGEMVTVKLEETAAGDTQAKEHGATGEHLVSEMGEKMVSVYLVTDFDKAPDEGTKPDYQLTGDQISSMEIATSKTMPKGWLGITWDGGSSYFWALEAEVKAAAPGAKIDSLDPDEPKDVDVDDGKLRFVATKDIVAMAMPAMGAETDIAPGETIEVLDDKYPGNVKDQATDWVQCKVKGKQVYVLAYDLSSGAKAVAKKGAEEPPKKKAKAPVQKLNLYFNVIDDVGYNGYEEGDPDRVKSHRPDVANPGWSIVVDDEDTEWRAKTAELNVFLGLAEDVEDESVEAPKIAADPKDYPAGRHMFKPDHDVSFMGATSETGALDVQVDVEADIAKGGMSRFALTDDWTRTHGRSLYQYNGRQWWVTVMQVAKLLGWPVAAEVEVPKVVAFPEPVEDEDSLDMDATIDEIFSVEELSLMGASSDDLQYIIDMGSLSKSKLTDLTPEQIVALAKHINEPLDRLQKQIAELS